MVLVFLVLAFNWSAAHSTSGSILEEPGGAFQGFLRNTDSIRILRTEIIQQYGREQRWALIEYGDAFSKQTGWIRLDDLPTRTPPDRQRRGTAPQFDERLGEASITDIDIDCSRNHGDIIDRCVLWVSTDIEPGPNVYNREYARVICSVDLHWAGNSGRKQTSTGQASRDIELGRRGRSERLMISYDFRPDGAAYASVENQQCRVESAKPWGRGYKRH